MLTDYYQSAPFMEQLRKGPAGPHMDGFAEELSQAGYAEITARRHIRAAQHLTHWAEQNQISLPDLDDAQVERFNRHLPQCLCRPYGRSDRVGLVRGARLFVDHLQRLGVVSPAPVDPPAPPPLLNAFRQWMQDNRNVGEATLGNYGRAVADLLETLGQDPSQFDAQRLREFVLERSQRCGRAKAKMITTALRAFLRFLIAEGQCCVGLQAAIPTLAYWHLSTLPRYLSGEEVERVISACDPDTAVGLRDRAILLLLARLGLRAGDIVDLRLGDIAWEEGSIRVSGKGRRETRLPLLQEVGEAIVAYLTRVRPAVKTQILFLRSRAPLRGFRSHSAVSVLVANAMRRAGIDRTVRGAAHVLRHSAATAMLRQGASLQDIAAVLRHRSIETAAIYAKVDVVALAAIAQPWPEVDPC
jgi:site-specific recombinase XerD